MQNFILVKLQKYVPVNLHDELSEMPVKVLYILAIGFVYFLSK